MPLLALKHRCLKFLKDQSILIDCFEQESFLRSLNYQHVLDVLDVPTPSAISDNLVFLASGEFDYMIHAIRRAQFNLGVKLEIFSLVMKERLGVLQSMLIQSSGQERLYASTLLDSAMKFYEFICTQCTDEMIGLFFDDYLTSIKYFKNNKFIYLKDLKSMFNWRENTCENLEKDAAKAFKTLLHGNNRRAKFLNNLNEFKSDYSIIYEFFTTQEKIFYEIINN